MSFGASRRHKDMSGALDREPLSLLGRRLMPGFAMRVAVVGPGGSRAYDEAEWRDAIVVVEYGEIVLESRGGDSYRFGRGAVLWLEGLSLLALRNPGPEAAVLVAVSRRAPTRPA
jgi:hypothetical protein